MPKASVPAPPTPTRETTTRQTARRRFLTGGAAAIPTIVTLASRPALATNGGQCSISGFQSAVHSINPADRTSCGSPPSSWLSHTDMWPAGFTTSTTVASKFTGLSGYVVAPANVTFLQVLNGTGTFSKTFTVGSGGSAKSKTTVNGNNTLLKNMVAAALNAAFFGSAYNQTLSGINTALTTALTNGNNAGTSGTNQQKADAKAAATDTALSTLNSALNTSNTRGI